MNLSNIFRGIIAVVFGLLTFIGVSIFALLVYNGNKEISGILISILILALALFLGYKVFKITIRRGVLEVLTGAMATPELDNLEPVDDKELRKLSAYDLVLNFQNKTNFFNGGYLRIWGDWRERDLEVINELDELSYDDQIKLLTIYFKNENMLLIWYPEIIMETKTYLKINKAKKIRWEWTKEGKTVNYCEYGVHGNNIKIDTNTSWKSSSMDTILGQPAVFLYI